MVSENDIEKAKLLGYNFNSPAKDAADLINQFFPGIDLITLLQELEYLLSPHTEKPAEKKVIIVPMPSPYFQVLYLSSEHWDDVKGLTMSRIFEYEQNRLIVKHDYLVLPENARGKKLAQRSWLCGLNNI
jgi:hypothetical protein